MRKFRALVYRAAVQRNHRAPFSSPFRMNGSRMQMEKWIAVDNHAVRDSRGNGKDGEMVSRGRLPG